MLTPVRLAEISKAASLPMPENPAYERMRGFVGELLDELSVEKESHVLRLRRDLAALHVGKAR